MGSPTQGKGYRGIVLAAQANYYWVQLDDLEAQGGPWDRRQLLCTRRTRLKKIGQQVMVGDQVWVEEPDWAGGRGAIAQVAPRQTVLDRPPVANADHILLVFALADPALDPYQLSRFLVKAESTGLRVSLCLNKRDLVTPATEHHWIERLQQWGYQPLCISVRARTPWPTLKAQLRHHITIISGPSGVGKSSLINCLIPEADLRTSQVSGKLGHGRHTTRHVELFTLPTGGLLADTPGFNHPDIECSPATLALCFPEIRRRLQAATCQFNDCLHRDEPGCAVRGDWERYGHYQRLLTEALAHQETISQQTQSESTLKGKTTAAGQVHHEPKLNVKKYRRPSRRRRNQALQDLYHDLLADAELSEEIAWEDDS
ncbi:small ribosomal subunit biogenesis GTPase RsgA [Halomicronema hongdechloris]|uniref:small ribosomal subunit biogenesis GTPase RsgA n=1 Tax=Halomicronema hongdechloris TaxID=1209493 RepID=UPI001CECD2EC|nr:small ribosomal subunit biogenesis GTPase RsgA [Halomicronema hongdechloris]